MATSDQEYYKAFLQGYVAAFEALVLRHRHAVVYFTLAYTKNFESAEDIAQEVFAWFYLHPDRYQPRCQLKTFLFTIAKRRAIDLMRRQGKAAQTDLESVQGLADRKTLEDLVFHRETMEALEAAVKRLKPEYRQALWLTQWNGLSLAETGEILEKTVAATKVLVHRARKALRKEMEKEDSL